METIMTTMTNAVVQVCNETLDKLRIAVLEKACTQDNMIDINDVMNIIDEQKKSYSHLMIATSAKTGKASKATAIKEPKVKSDKPKVVTPHNYFLKCAMNKEHGLGLSLTDANKLWKEVKELPEETRISTAFENKGRVYNADKFVQVDTSVSNTPSAPSTPIAPTAMQSITTTKLTKEKPQSQKLAIKVTKLQSKPIAIASDNEDDADDNNGVEETEEDEQPPVAPSKPVVVDKPKKTITRKQM